jgi:hypothetical protein
MTMFRMIGSLLMCLATAACGASAEEPASASDQGPADGEVPTGDGEQVLNRLSFEDLELTFYWMGPGSIDGQRGQIGIEESYGSVDYLGALREQHGQVTALEIFQAFAPAGMEPHEALIARHEAEALAYGRGVNDLEARTIDAHALPVDKAIPANCDSQVFPNILPRVYSNKQQRDIGADGQLFYLCVNSVFQAGGPIAQPTTNINCSLQHGKYELTVGICNDTASVNSTEFWTQTNDVRGSRFTTQRTSVAPGMTGRFTTLPLPPPFDRPGIRSLGVIGRNSTANVANFHRQLSALGVP